MTESVRLRVGIGASNFDPNFTSAPQYQIFVNTVPCTSVLSANLIETEYTDINLILERGDYTLRICNITDIPDARCALNIDYISLQGYEFAGWDRWIRGIVKFSQPRVVDGILSDYMGKCVNLTYDSEYQFKFSTPTYKWFLLNVKGNFFNPDPSSNSKLV